MEATGLWLVAYRTKKVLLSALPDSSGGGPVTREGAPLVGILRKKEELDKSLRGGYREAPGTGREQPVDDGGKSTEEFIERIKHRFEETHQMLFRMDQPGAGQH